MGKAIISRAEDYAQWYNDLVIKGSLADYSAVRGCMVIKPYGFALWENMRDALDKMFKDTGHVNAYFPLFVPKSLFEAEEKNAEGFAKECAVVTHYRLKSDPSKKGALMVDPDARLEEELVVRPTSEAIIWNTYKNWIQSYRDLPILINQWANVVRWEMRTRMFLRTAEFLWQEGHTAHATRDEAVEETMKMLDVYADFAENYMAMPVIKGEKTAGERFPGAEQTFCIEAMMQDRKALQAGTSHFLGQNFAKASGIQFLDQNGTQQHAWTTSWGVSTRLIGGMLMTHSDDDGLVLPPKLAPHHIVFIPIYRNDEERTSVLKYCNQVAEELRKQTFAQRKLNVLVDQRDERGGDKVWHWIKKGVPLRVEVGPRDMEKNSLFVARRDHGHKDKSSIERNEFIATAAAILQSIHDNLLAKAKAHRTAHTRNIDTKEEFYAYFTAPATEANQPTPIHGGFAMTHFCGDVELEKKIKQDLSVTVRCIPLDTTEPGICPFTGKPSRTRVVWAKSY